MKAYLQRYISNKRNKLDFIHNSLANSKTKTWGDSVELAYIGIRIDKYACEMKARPDHEESRVLVSGGPARGKCTYRYTNWRSQSLKKKQNPGSVFIDSQQGVTENAVQDSGPELYLRATAEHSSLS